MSFYEYDNGYYHCKTPIRNGFKRFHKCNAQERFFTLELTDDIDAEQAQHVFQFISYNTPICQIIYVPAHYVQWYIYVDENAYEFSRTTTKQFNRWLNEHAMYGMLQDGVWPEWLDSDYVRTLFEIREQRTPTSAISADASNHVLMLVCDNLSRVWE